MHLVGHEVNYPRRQTTYRGKSAVEAQPDVDRVVPTQPMQKSTASRPWQLLRRLSSYRTRLARHYPNWRQLLQPIPLGIVTLMVAGLAWITMLALLSGPDYQLTPQTRLLLSRPSAKLSSEISYSTAKHEYVINKNGTRQRASSSPTVLVGQPNKGLYTATLPDNLARGITVTNVTGQISFTLAPEFKAAPAKVEYGHFVYPAQDGIQAVYTPQTDQLAEDLVLTHSTGNTLNLDYRLRLPKGLTATPGADGTVLISRHGLSLFALAAPTIRESNGQKGGKAAPATARLVLNGSSLALAASGLAQLTYPVVIDPSILINSASGFLTGNNEGDVTASSNQFSESGLSGAELSSWTATTSLPSATDAAASVTYNGYVYDIGGTVSGSAVPTVVYAPVNSNGTLGSWTATTSLTTATYDASAVAYNGYIYEIGGCSSSCNLTTVYFAPINSNGTLGMWNSTTSLPTGQNTESSVVYNGYVYEIAGGWGVWYAPINSNGTLGSWTATSNPAQQLNAATSVVYNGYVYEIGGNVNGSPIATVYYAPINANGGLGSWGTTTSLLSATDAASSVVANGYIYEIGGCNVSNCATVAVSYASIHANGTLGSWTSTVNLSIAAAQATSVVYNGYIYEIGGNTPSGVTATVDYAQIEPAGYTSAYISTTSLPAATHDATAVTYNGYIYELGGCSPSCPSASVYFAQTTSTGALVDTVSSCPASGTLYGSTWCSTTSLPVGASDAAAFVYNGYIYFMGGDTTGLNSGQTDTIYYAQIDTTNGALDINGSCGSVWCTNSVNLPYSEDSMAVAAYNGYVYLIGGNQYAGNGNTSDYAPINSNGTIGSWTSGPNLSGPVSNGSLVVNNGYVYVIGGYNGSTVLTTVDYDSIGANGTLGSSWTPTSSLGTAVANAGTFIYNGYVYEVGGFINGNSATAVVEYAPFNANGVGLGNWANTSSLPGINGAATTVETGGYVYNMGGENGYGGTANAVVNYAQINNGGPGTLGSWTTISNSLPQNVNFATVAYNGYAYAIGGSGSTGLSSAVYYSPITSTGGLGSWTATTSLPAATEFATSVVAYNGYIYKLGGYNGSSEISTVYYAKIDTANGALDINGSCGNVWCTTTSLPTATADGASVVYNGYVYEIGGCVSAGICSTPTAAVYYAKIDTANGALDINGSCGNVWCTTTSLPTATSDGASLVYNGIVYILDGIKGVFFSKINNNGALSSWTKTTNLPSASGGSPLLSAYDGYIYEVGGSMVSYVSYAPINTNGSLGAWTATTGLPGALASNSLNGVVYEGYIYDIGGDASGAQTNPVFYTALNSIPRVGQYSMLVNLGNGVNVTPVTIEVNGSNTGNSGTGGFSGLGGVTIQFRNATTGCSSFSPSSTVNLGEEELGTPYKMIFTSDGCGNTTALGEYAWVHFTLDDSQTASFPDVNGNHTTVTGFQIFYHPAASLRLRGGKIVQNGVQSSLDAPPTTTQ